MWVWSHTAPPWRHQEVSALLDQTYPITGKELRRVAKLPRSPTTNTSGCYGRKHQELAAPRFYSQVQNTSCTISKRTGMISPSAPEKSCSSVSLGVIFPQPSYLNVLLLQPQICARRQIPWVTKFSLCSTNRFFLRFSVSKTSQKQTLFQNHLPHF